jgi:hypothetical protein
VAKPRSAASVDSKYRTTSSLSKADQAPPVGRREPGGPSSRNAPDTTRRPRAWSCA